LNEFQNPQQDPGSERRLLIAFVLTFLVIILMQPLLMRQRPEPPAAEPETVAEALAPAVEPAAESARPTPAAPPPPAVTRQAEVEEQTVIENDIYRITFSNRGAHVTSWILKEHTDRRGEPLDLVHPVAAPLYGYPLSLWTYDEALRGKLATALYVPSVTGRQRAPAEVTFEYADGETAVRKTFRFEHRSYVVRVETSVTQHGGFVQAFPAWPAGFGDQTIPASYAMSKVEWQHGQEITRHAPKNVSGGGTLPGPFHWAATTDQYFGAVFLPDEPENAVMVTLHEELQIPRNLDKPVAGETQRVSVLGLAVGSQQGPTQQRLFVGPKTLRVLSEVNASLTRQERAVFGIEAVGPSLESVVDFGWFSFLARPLFLWLRWTYENWIPNWGWSILFLTLCINIALLPLRIKQMKSGMRMQKLAPQIKVIQEKYKKYSLRDPRKAGMQQEMAALYKSAGVNPLSGCWPVLLQFPFLIAFYMMLINAVELRHASWMWIGDLSAPDPYYLLPIIMMVSMFTMQKLTPMGAMDPMQQKMLMVMMPLMLGLISLTFAAGLVLYWTAGNFIAMAQQLIMNRTKFGREMRAEAAKRAARRKEKEKAAR
jgi:YidC/Oxa1 family membrane protein insertase